MHCGFRGCCFIMVVPLRQFLHLFFVTRALPRIHGVSVREFPCLCDCLNSLWFCCEVFSFCINFPLVVVFLFSLPSFVMSVFFFFWCQIFSCTSLYPILLVLPSKFQSEHNYKIKYVTVML